mmetsp:Transcript_35814/g.82201  ORF Transcript_35814/g.82201 Transcript_35814/m.82201 type:complete len:366 (-) Transcript_35814:44-1141(-)
MEPPAKKARMSLGPVTLEVLKSRIDATDVCPDEKAKDSKNFIATHHGTFHADEVMACVMLKCLPEYEGIPVVRTRTQEVISEAKIVVDVGGTYEPESHRYDHHQSTFTTTYSEEYEGIKLSSAGLVYKHFGDAVIEALCGKLSEKSLAAIKRKTYDTLIRELDALDNGVQVADAPRYRIVTHLGSRVGRLNPSWLEESTPQLENDNFKKAMHVAAQELMDVITGYCASWLPARSIVEEALDARKYVHQSAEIMKLTRFCPWTEHLFDLEEEIEKHREPLTKYVLFQDSRGGWRVQAVPKERGSFANRLALPEAWRGKREEELSTLSGIPGCVFVHAAGFIGGHRTEAGAMAMASSALEMQTTKSS